MLQLLRDNYAEKSISLTTEFRRDLAWFENFLTQSSDISIYNHAVVRDTVELDACLTDLGAVCGNYVYHLKSDQGYGNLIIVHAEHFVGILDLWLPVGQMKLLIKCDNDEVVKVLNSGCTCDPFLGACERNIWFQAALWDVDDKYVHVLGSNNQTADLFSRWEFSADHYNKLSKLVENPLCLNVSYQMLFISIEI